MRTNICALLAACALWVSACGGPNNASPETATDAARTSASPSSAAASTASPSDSPVVVNESRGGAPPAEAVRVSASPVEVRAGGRAEASVRLDITPPYHVNANPPSQSFLIPTEVTLAPEPGVKPGKPAYPAALKKKFAFAEQPLAVYEGDTEIKFPLSVEATAAKGERTLRAKVRVQPCDDNACYPPRNVETTITLNIK